MIQAADVGERNITRHCAAHSRFHRKGVGIVGKEGKQASLAADFSVIQFSYLTKLLLWHGRNSYRRSAKLAQFVIHRGLIISIMQAVFSAIFYFAPIALYQGWLMVGYATVYTMAPVFSLVLDRDVSEDLALLYPELYKELTKVLFFPLLLGLIDGRIGACFVVQDILPVVYDQPLPRYAILLGNVRPYLSYSRCCDHDHVSGSLRERIPSHCFDFLYCSNSQRTHHGCARDYYMV